MRSILPEWYAHDGKTIKRVVTSGTVSFDANILLDLYRVSKEQRAQILDVLTAISDRIFIPFQVAYEFHKNRLTVVRDNEEIYKTLL